MKPLGKLPITKRQMRVWNRRRLELIAAATELKQEPELAFVAAQLVALIESVDCNAAPTLSPFMSSNAQVQPPAAPARKDDETH